MRATPIGEVVGDRTNYTASTGHPRSMDLPVPLGARLPSSTLINLNKTKLLEEIANQLSMGANNLMEDDKYLLEWNLLDLATTDGEQQEYWLLAIKVARMVSLIHQQTTQQLSISTP